MTETNAELVSPEKDLHSSKTRKNKMDDIVDDVYNEMIHDMEFLEVYGDTFTTKSSADNDHNAVNTINKEKILRPIYLVLSRDNGTLEVRASQKVFDASLTFCLALSIAEVRARVLVSELGQWSSTVDAPQQS